MRQRTGGAGARWRGPLLLLVFAAVCCGRPSGGDVSDASHRAPDSGATLLQIELRPAANRAQPAYVSVIGLTAPELSSLRDPSPSAAEWPSLLKITVGDDVRTAVPAVEGRYTVTDSAITFTPLFPFDPGRTYHVLFDPSRLPRPRREAMITAVVRLPAVATEPSTVVTAVHPSAEVVPENLLRIYIEFSAPMGNATGLDFVKLVELSGPDNKAERVEPGAFLPVEADFWSPDHTRYTLFFDPGRVKDDILPNRQSGRPLRAGRRYALDIDAAWPDANGLPLKAGYRRAFRAGPAIDDALKLSDWQIARPAAGTRDRLVVRFPHPLDHGILVRALGIETKNQRPVDGQISLEAHDTAWVFTPVAPWRGGEYNLVALAFLEDPQGNQIGRAFESLAGDGTNDRGPDAFRVAFTIGAP